MFLLFILFFFLFKLFFFFNLADKLQELNDLNKVPQIFMVNGSVAKRGDVVKNPLLATALEALNRDENAFYGGGSLTKMTIDDSQGQFSEQDLKAYSAIATDPVLASYNGKIFFINQENFYHGIFI